MRRLLLILAACAAALAQAATVTLSTGASCAYETITTSASGNVSVVCAKSDTPTTPPVTPPTTPPVTPPPVGSTVILHDNPADPMRIPGPGQATHFYAAEGQIHSWPLPANRGALTSSDYPGTPSLTIEWSISRTPGDVNYYKTDAAKVPSGRGGPTVVVCGQQSGATGGVAWGPEGLACRVPTGERWYVNYRIVAQCPSGTLTGVVAGCPINYYWN